MNSNEDKLWGIKAAHSMPELEELLNDLQDKGMTIHEINTKDLIVVYYKDESNKERIDE